METHKMTQIGTQDPQNRWQLDLSRILGKGLSSTNHHGNPCFLHFRDYFTHILGGLSSNLHSSMGLWGSKGQFLPQKTSTFADEVDQPLLYRGFWMCVAWVWDLQTTSFFEIPWFLIWDVHIWKTQLRLFRCFFSVDYTTQLKRWHYSNPGPQDPGFNQPGFNGLRKAVVSFFGGSCLI